MDANDVKTIKEATSNSFKKHLSDIFQTILPLCPQLCEGLTVTTAGAAEVFDKVPTYRLDPGLSKVKSKASQQQVVASTVIATLANWFFSILLEQLVFPTYDKIALEVEEKKKLKKQEKRAEKDKFLQEVTSLNSLTASPDSTLDSHKPTLSQPPLNTSANAKRSDKSDDKIATLTTKKCKNESSTGDNNVIITGYQPEKNDKNLTLNLVVYNIPAKWTNYQLLSKLNKWGKVVSVSTRVQKKYQTARVRLTPNHNCLKAYNNGDWTVSLSSIPVRWFLAAWSLSE
ncbi:hypothetical protein RclHR1_33810001 [Rhizophagus clarus]|uniref:Uncharacterized protein n=1 Tax=Rhizophagus clarus TaxID=94130 RepID=A0A2Z6S3U7_9GLOM|nr:hypothetical protein RclHR1_33810001 [Rhizophagus clarus]